MLLIKFFLSTKNGSSITNLKRLKEDSMKQRTKKVTETYELIRERNLHSFWRDKEDHHINPPTRKFSLGDKVLVGALQNCIIVEILDNGKVYGVDHDRLNHNERRDPSDNGPKRVIGFWSWQEILPMSANDGKSNFTIKEDIRIRFFNSTTDSLFNKVYSQGVDFTPEYQRDYVWELSDKVSLIHSIFNQIDIGKFTFYVRSYEEEVKVGDHCRNEIIDGKQRLSTLVEFYEDRFPYMGKLFSELSFKDRCHFTGFDIIYGETENLTREQKIKLFLKVNTTGKVMDAQHLANVAKLIA